MSKLVILTGLRANNNLQLGNYLGALLPIVDMQKKHIGKYQINLFVPDLHSFTTPINHSKLYEQTINNVRIYVAAGLDISDPDTFVYRQSRIPAHSELAIILNCFTYMGELNRMTQYKEKNEGQTSVSAGLFDYPVLMAADILLYGAKYVPVGADQTQHVELARDIAIRINNKFEQDIFQLPEAEKEQIAFTNSQERLRVRDLQKPDKKMSKSDESGKGVIFLTDSPEVAAKKVMSATTDSLSSVAYDKQNQPGISNLLEILATLTGQDLKDVIAQYQGQTQYGPLKMAAAEAVSKLLTDFQTKLSQVDDAAVMAKLEASEAAMNKTANTTLLQVQKAVGLRS